MNVFSDCHNLQATHGRYHSLYPCRMGEEYDQITAIIREQGQSHECQCAVLSMRGKRPLRMCACMATHSELQ